MAGKTTAIDKKTSLSGSGMGLTKSASVSVNETARPLLTADECMRLPGMMKDSSGNVARAGDMLVFTAGRNPIYGRQILYFRDPVFSSRAKILPAGAMPEYPGGVSDSIYHDMPYSAGPGRKAPEPAEKAEVIPADASGESLNAYFQ